MTRYERKKRCKLGWILKKNASNEWDEADRECASEGVMASIQGISTRRNSAPHRKHKAHHNCLLLASPQDLQKLTRQQYQSDQSNVLAEPLSLGIFNNAFWPLELCIKQVFHCQGAAFRCCPAKKTIDSQWFDPSESFVHTIVHSSCGPNFCSPVVL
jgi:hypothetical protein